MAEILISWIGATDLRSMQESEMKGASGPIAQACIHKKYSDIVLISDYPPKKTDPFIKWLQPQTTGNVGLIQKSLTSPTNYSEIYTAALNAIESSLAKYGPDANLTLHLSPGTPAMAAVWMLLSTKYRDRATLIESSINHGVNKVEIPFDISHDFLPDQHKRNEQNLQHLAAGVPIGAPKFKDIIHRSQIMQKAIYRAQLVAMRNTVPVLIEGESGTGKELFARAIHETSTRTGNFISINCGAIPKELVESVLFGHEKGSFTGATERRTGQFEAANGGTIFLDEVGELPKDMQVKILRTVQESEVKPIGATESKSVDLRFIAATNRTLIDEVESGYFREDLFYRLAVAVIKLPPLRMRDVDISLLTKHFLNEINKEFKGGLGYKEKTISAAGMNILRNHPWPGNVRELKNTLTRAMVWTENEIIDEEDIREALFQVPSHIQEVNDIMEQALDDSFDINILIEQVRAHYYKRALAKANGNITRSAKLLGLPNYQTLTNWLKKNNFQSKT